MKKKVLIIIAGVLIVGGGALAYSQLVLNTSSDKSTPNKAEKKAPVDSDKPAPLPDVAKPAAKKVALKTCEGIKSPEIETVIGKDFDSKVASAGETMPYNAQICEYTNDNFTTRVFMYDYGHNRSARMGQKNLSSDFQSRIDDTILYGASVTEDGEQKADKAQALLKSLVTK